MMVTFSQNEKLDHQLLKNYCKDITKSNMIN